MDGMLSYAMNDNTGSRHTVIGTIDRTASSSYDSQIFSARVGAGANIQMDGYTLIPNMGLTYSAINSDEYTETGADGLNLKTNTEDMQKITAVAGLNFSKAIKTNSGAIFTPELRVAYQYELGDKYSSSTSSFTGGGAFIEYLR